MPKPRAPDDSRNRLLAAAKKLFAVRGFDGVSVRDVVAAAGVNVSLVSYYFGGKQGLYEACIAEYGAHRLSRLGELLEPPRSKDELRLGLRMILREIIISQLEEPLLT